MPELMTRKARGPQSGQHSIIDGENIIQSFLYYFYDFVLPWQYVAEC